VTKTRMVNPFGEGVETQSARRADHVELVANDR
jgi:hypothetical protein